VSKRIPSRFSFTRKRQQHYGYEPLPQYSVFHIVSGFHLFTYETKNMVGGKVKLTLCLTNEALRHEGVWGSGRNTLKWITERWPLQYSLEVAQDRGQQQGLKISRTELPDFAMRKQVSATLQQIYGSL
jgi:hypothetical protein